MRLKNMYSCPKEWGDLSHVRGDLGQAWESWVIQIMSVQIRQNRHSLKIKQEQFNYEHPNHYSH